MFGCQECMYKQFPFPVAENDEERSYGLVCIVCETKLYINNVTQGIMERIGKIERKMARKEKEIEEIMIERNEWTNKVNELKTHQIV